MKQFISRILSNILLPIFITFICFLTGCARNNLNAPCPNFGATCHQAPVNHWDDNKF